MDYGCILLECHKEELYEVVMKLQLIAAHNTFDDVVVNSIRSLSSCNATSANILSGGTSPGGSDHRGLLHSRHERLSLLTNEHLVVTSNNLANYLINAEHMVLLDNYSNSHVA
jgi:hypothetical protein